MRTPTWLLAILMTAVALSGCAGDEGGDDADATPTPTPTGGGGGGPTATPTPTGTGGGGSGGGGSGGGGGGDGGDAGERLVNITADIDAGDAPLTITFTLILEGATADTTWQLDFGDGATESGAAADLLESYAHEFAAGEYEVVFSADFGDEVLEDAVAISIADPTGSAPTDFRLDYAATLPFVFPAGLQFLVGDEFSEGGFCWTVISAKEQGLNETAIVYFDVVVDAGAKSIYIEGGNEDLTGTGFVPDFDVVLVPPSLAECHTGGSEGSYETLGVDDPEPGTWLAACLHWFGTPIDECTGFIAVDY